MAFSNTPQETVSELSALLDVAGKLAILLDKDKLQQTVKDFYGLSASEKLLAEEARASIAQYESLIKEQNKKKAALDAFEASLQSDKIQQDKYLADGNAALDAKKKLNDDTLAEIKNANIALDARETALNKREDSIAQKQKDLAIANTALDVKAENIRKQQLEIDSKKQEVADYEASLKATSAELQKITQRL